jgi:uncharacterized protein YbjT (DUF2867 family)
MTAGTQGSWPRTRSEGRGRRCVRIRRATADRRARRRWSRRRGVAADLDDPPSIPAALTGAEAVYHLAHSLGSPHFEQREQAHARTVAAAARGRRVRQLVFLGGLGRDDDRLSPHLRSRRQVERALTSGSVPVTVLRAGILIGGGSVAWEMLRQVVEVVPLSVSDARARTRHQPIAACDAVGYLVDVLGRDDCLGRTLEIGGADVLSYREMVSRLAALTHRLRPQVTTPWLPDVVAAAGVELITDVDGALARDLLGSMANEAVVTDDAATGLLHRTVLGFDDAARLALAEAGPGRSRAAVARSMTSELATGRFLRWSLRQLAAGLDQSA